MIRLFKYTSHQFDARLCPFENAFANDLWIAYHGTSDKAENSIESGGFVQQAPRYSRAEIESVLRIFELLHWAGTRSGGYVVLSAFTKHDYHTAGSGSIKPVFFAETGFRAVLYAFRDWAGGETARALRYAFADLRDYCESNEFRQRAVWDSWKRIRSFFGGKVPQGCEASSANDVSFCHVRALLHYYKTIGIPAGNAAIAPEDHMAWLKDQLAYLNSLEARCQSDLSTFRYGLVYAVRFLPTDVPYLTYPKRGLLSGLEAYHTIPPDRIIAKAEIPGSLSDDAHLPVNHGLHRIIDGDGVVGRTRRK